MSRVKEHRYRVYGLAIASRIACPALLPDAEDTEPDVRIEMGEVPESLGPGRREGFNFESTDSQLLIKTRRIANILVSNGTTLRVQPHAGSTEDGIRMLLLGWGMGALLHQRDLMPLHAGVVARSGGAVAFCAHSGIGKSTLAATLICRGFRMLDDNLAALDFSGDEPVVYPGCPEIKLREDVMAWCPREWKDQMPSWRFAEKTAMFLHPYFDSDSRPLRAVFIMSAEATQGPGIRRLAGAEAFHRISEQVFCRRFLDGMGRSERHFRKILQIANRVPSFSLELGIPKPHPQTLVDALEPVLEQVLRPGCPAPAVSEAR